MLKKSFERIERVIRDVRDEYFRKYNDEPLPKEIYSADLPKKTISFCTTCMNRLFHLRKTLIKNVENNKNYPGVEFVLINYNSKDTLHQWAKDNLTPYIKQGLVNYYFTPEPEIFHASVAKNLAHKVAQGEIVCNLDGDNFTGKDYAFYINYKMQQVGMKSVLQFKKAPFWGTEGRVVMAKRYFMELGGYDENLAATGHEDHDLMDRAKALGLHYENIQIENFLHYLSNTTKEKTAHVSKETLNYYDLESSNREQSQRNIANNLLQANPQGWGTLPLYKNFSEKAQVY